MRNLLLLLALMFCSTAFAQGSNSSFSSVKHIIEKDFSGIANIKYSDLVPFRVGDKWGYIDRNTKKVVVSAKYDGLSFFKPNMNGSYQGHYFTLDKEGKFLVDEEEEIFMVSMGAIEEEYAKIKIVSSEGGFKGFTVDKKGQLTSFSDEYYFHKNMSPYANIKPLKKGNKTYAIAVNKQGLYGVIDSVGNTMEGLDFRFKNLALNEFALDKQALWFFAQIDNDNWSLINDKGKIKYRNEIFVYPSDLSTYFGYTLLCNDDVYGIFDSHEMKWIQKKKPKNIECGFYYSADSEVDKYDPAGRKKVNLYYAISDQASTYYVDLKGTRYIPNE